MKKFISILIALLFTTGLSAEINDWTKKEQYLYDSFITLQAMDLIQTFTIIECQQSNPYCPYYEKNKLLGTHPSKGEAIVFKAAANYMIFKIIDQPKYNGKRERLLKGLNVVSIYPVIHNEQIGLGFYVPILPYNQFRK